MSRRTMKRNDLGETRREIKRLEKVNVQWDDFVDQLDKLVLDIEGIPY